MNVDLRYMDGYYARRLADLHLEYEIPLSFIKPKEKAHLMQRNIGKVLLERFAEPRIATDI